MNRRADVNAQSGGLAGVQGAAGRIDGRGREWVAAGRRRDVGKKPREEEDVCLTDVWVPHVSGKPREQSWFGKQVSEHMDRD